MDRFNGRWTIETLIIFPYSNSIDRLHSNMYMCELRRCIEKIMIDELVTVIVAAVEMDTKTFE